MPPLWPARQRPRAWVVPASPRATTSSGGLEEASTESRSAEREKQRQRDSEVRRVSADLFARLARSTDGGGTMPPTSRRGGLLELSDVRGACNTMAGSHYPMPGCSRAEAVADHEDLAALLENMFRHTDLNGDGRVDWEEWRAFSSSMHELLGSARYLAIVGGWREALRSELREDSASGRLPSAWSAGGRRQRAFATVGTVAAPAQSPRMPGATPSQHTSAAEAVSLPSLASLGSRPSASATPLHPKDVACLLTEPPLDGGMWAASGRVRRIRLRRRRLWRQPCPEQPRKRRHEEGEEAEVAEEGEEEHAAEEGATEVPDEEADAAADEETEEPQEEEGPKKPLLSRRQRLAELGVEVNDPNAVEADDGLRAWGSVLSARNKFGSLVEETRAMEAQGRRKRRVNVLMLPADADAEELKSRSVTYITPKLLESLQEVERKQIECKLRPGELPLTTVDELWNIITMQGKKLSTSVPVVDIVDYFHRCKETGLGLQLVGCIPMLRPELKIVNREPEDLSPGEVNHLCMMLIDALQNTLLDESQEDPMAQVTEEGVREQLRQVREECRSTSYRDLLVDKDASIPLPCFRKLMDLLSLLMQIDEPYIISHFYWEVRGHFEITDVMATMLMKHCAQKKVSRKTLRDVAASGESAVFALLEDKFTAQDFDKLCKRCHVDGRGDRAGISSSKASHIFATTTRKLQDQVTDRISARPKVKSFYVHRKGTRVLADPAPPVEENPVAVAAKPAAAAQDSRRTSTLPPSSAAPRPPSPSGSGSVAAAGSKQPVDHCVGRTEFSIVLEALWRALPKGPKQYTSPMHMCIEFLYRHGAKQRAKAKVSMISSDQNSHDLQAAPSETSDDELSV